MSDQIRLELHANPWQPTADTQLVKTYNYYDMPLMGRLYQATPFLFWCLLGQSASDHLWAYIPLTESEIAAVEKLQGEEIDRLALRMLTSRRVTVALASDDRGILLGGEMETIPWTDGTSMRDTFVDAAQAAVDVLSDEARSTSASKQLLVASF